MHGTLRWAVTAAALLPLAIIPLTGGSASAATCYAGSCTGRDPIAAGCASDAVTLASIPDGWMNHGTLQLRFSPTCGAAWAKAVNVGSLSELIDVTNDDAAENYPVESVWTSGGSGYTDMVDDAGVILAQACDYYASTCTSWH